MEDPLDNDGRTMDPDLVEKVLLRTAKDHPCPAAGFETYRNEGRDATFDAPCAGNTQVNGIYGEGIVNALAALTAGEALVDDD